MHAAASMLWMRPGSPGYTGDSGLSKLLYKQVHISKTHL